ncbi:hypothetical protein TcWFU_002946 [Taenia crassiceps]|uniref:Uncharacterized protein n=1 Tax=Taenia crassiceps TaxID=6207 RepID=A0ABR4Q7Y8_9CEST
MSDLNVSSCGLLCSLVLVVCLLLKAVEVVIGNSLNFICLLWTLVEVVDFLVDCRGFAASDLADGSEGKVGGGAVGCGLTPLSSHRPRRRCPRRRRGRPRHLPASSIPPG